MFCGYANSDVCVHVPALPVEGDRIQAQALQRYDGGMAANAAAAAARAGAVSAFAGMIGAGPLDDAFLAALVADGVDTSWTARDGRLTSAVVLIGPGRDRAVISEDDDMTLSHIAATARAVASARDGLLYLDGYRFPAAAEVLQGIEGLRCAVDLDGCTLPGAAMTAADLADHVIGGPAHAALLGPDPATAAVKHRVNLLVTDGPHGWRLYLPDGSCVRGPALPVDVVDTTGAGDCFAGNYLARVDRGCAPADAARYAAVAAGLTCTTAGARGGSPGPAQVREVLAGGGLTGRHDDG